MRHVTCMNEARHRFACAMSASGLRAHAYEWVMSHLMHIYEHTICQYMNESRHRFAFAIATFGLRAHLYEWVMSQIIYIYEHSTSYIRMSHVTGLLLHLQRFGYAHIYMNESCLRSCTYMDTPHHIYEWVTSQGCLCICNVWATRIFTWMSHVSDHLHIWTLHIIYTNESRHRVAFAFATFLLRAYLHEWVMSQIMYVYGHSTSYIRMRHVTGLPLHLQRFCYAHIYMNESCLRSCTYMDTSHHIYEWVTSQGCLCICDVWATRIFTWMSHVSSHAHVRMIHGTYMIVWVMSRVWMSHVTRINASWHTYECVMAHIWMRHVAHMSASWHTYECVMSHIWMRHVAHINDSRHIYEWVTSQVCLCSVSFWAARTYIWWMSHIMHNVSHHAYHLHKWCTSHICDVTYSYMWRVLFEYAHDVRHSAYIYACSPKHICVQPKIYMRAAQKLPWPYLTSRISFI